MGLLDPIFGGSEEVEPPKLEDYLPWLQTQMDFNRIDTKTPWGGVRWNEDPNAPQALSFDDWKSQNPMEPVNNYSDGINWAAQLNPRNPREPQPGSVTEPDYQGGYQNYLTDFETNNPNIKTPEAYFSPEIQSLFNKQFQPDAYSQYGDEYMANIENRLNPIFDRQQEDFRQIMANRGQPVGGELYDDQYGLLSQSQNDAWQNAAVTADQLGQNAKLQDFNRLMAAFGGTTVPIAPIDTMGPMNTALNINAQNAALANQNNSNVWNTTAMLGSSYLMNAPEDSSVYNFLYG